MDNGGVPGSSDKLVWDFDWHDVPGASRYQIEISNEIMRAGLDGLGGPLVMQEVSSSVFHYEKDGYFEQGAGWIWRVRANVGGTWTDWSETRPFALRAPTLTVTKTQPVVPPSPPVPELKLTKQELPVREDRPANTVCFAFSRDLRRVAGGRGRLVLKSEGKVIALGGEVVVWNVATAEIETKLGQHEETVEWLGFSADGKRLASASRDRVIKIWDVASTKVMRQLQLPQKYFNPNGFGPLLTFTPEGSRLIAVLEKLNESGQPDLMAAGDIVAWDTATGNELWRIPDSRVTTIALSPNGSTLAGAGRVSADDGRQTVQIKLWNTVNGNLTGMRNQPKFLGYGWLRFHPDSKTLLCADVQGVSRLDLDSGDVTNSFSWDPQRRPFNVLEWSPATNRIARGWGEYVELVDATSGKAIGLHRFPANQPGIGATVFSPDLKRMAGLFQATPCLFGLQLTN